MPPSCKVVALLACGAWGVARAARVVAEADDMLADALHDVSAEEGRGGSASSTHTAQASRAAKLHAEGHRAVHASVNRSDADGGGVAGHLGSNGSTHATVGTVRGHGHSVAGGLGVGPGHSDGHQRPASLAENASHQRDQRRGLEADIEAALRKDFKNANEDESLCFVDEDQFLIGCKARCRCPWFNSCFPRHVVAPGSKEGFLDVGECSISIGMSVLSSIFILFGSVGAIVAIRMALQWHEEEPVLRTRIVKGRGLRGSKAGPPGRASGLYMGSVPLPPEGRPKTPPLTREAIEAAGFAPPSDAVEAVEEVPEATEPFNSASRSPSPQERRMADVSGGLEPAAS